MSKKKYEKLVRDRIPNILIKQGKAFKCHHVEGRGYQTALALKVLEEAKEVNVAAQDYTIKGEPTGVGEPPNLRKNQLVEEIADLMEATFALMKAFEISKDRVKEAMTDKAKTKGKFSEGIYLEWVDNDA